MIELYKKNKNLFEVNSQEFIETTKDDFDVYKELFNNIALNNNSGEDTYTHDLWKYSGDENVA